MPIIVLSEAGEDPDVVEALAAGAWDHLEKPISMERLVRQVRSATEGPEPVGEARLPRGKAPIWRDVEADWLQVQQHFESLNARLKN